MWQSSGNRRWWGPMKLELLGYQRHIYRYRIREQVLSRMFITVQWCLTQPAFQVLHDTSYSPYYYYENYPVAPAQPV